MSRFLRVPRPTPEAYRRVTLVTLVSLVLIVVTGAAVRLTGSGLGCTDWPNCTSNHLVAPLHWHAWVEFGNRLITGFITFPIVAATIGAHRRRPWRRDLAWLSWGLVIGLVLDIVLGAVVVHFDLNPVLVQCHFLVSMAMVADALVLHVRAGWDGEGPDAPATRPRVDAVTLRLGRVAAALAGLVLVTGTVVTGSGPHAGDEHARRLHFTVHSVARVHGGVVFLFLAVAVALAWKLRHDGAPADVLEASVRLLFVLVLQGAVGYTQYFTGIPALLVALHVLGACLVWLAALDLLLRLSGPAVRPPDLDHDIDGTGRDLVAKR